MTKDNEFYWVVVYSPEATAYNATLFPYTLSDLQAHGYAPVAAFKWAGEAWEAQMKLNKAAGTGWKYV